ncbi:MAG: hypothetical protein IT299_10505 [Dehalococcoidia bacterium]|nr:hypothetical protein [Dehalococcoidia bacterium]
MSAQPPSGSRSQSPTRVLLEQSEGATRRGILRKALVFTPAALLFVGVTLAALYNAVTNSMGALVGAVVFGIPAAALTYEAWSCLGDLRSEPMTTRGVVTRMWHKGTVLWMTRSYYLLVNVSGNPRGEQRFFVVPQETYLQLDEGRTIEVRHWPHTNAVIALEEVEGRSGRAGSRG